MKDQRSELVQAAALELKRRKEDRIGLVDDNFPEQARFVRDNSRFCAAKTTRRAGKSTGLVYKHLNAGRRHRGCMMPFIGLTRLSAKNIIFPAFLQVSEKHKLGLEFRESDLTIRIPGNSTVQLYGADMKNFIQRIRGIKTPMSSIDEGQSFRSHLSELVDDILTPATGDFVDGQVNLTGTPGPVPRGYFHEATTGSHGFNTHSWTVYDNPYFPTPKEFVAKLMKTKNWTRDNPTYRREWLGEWVADLEALVYKFHPKINTVREVPKNENYFHVIGVDLGFYPDPSAFVVGAYSEYDQNLYIRETHTQEKMDVSSVAKKIKELLKIYPDSKVVMDLGAQGKMIGEEIKKRFQIPVVAAEKHGKAGFIEIMNSDLGTGVIKLVEGECEPLIEEWMNLIWDAEKLQRVEDSRYPNHLADAALYLWRYCYNYAYQNKPEVIQRGSEREIEDYWEKEAEKLEQNQREARRNARDDDMAG